MSTRTSSLVLTLILLTIGISLYADTKVITRMGGMGGSTCEGVTIGESFLEGSYGTISVRVIPKNIRVDFAGFPSEKPEWLSLEFSYYRENGDFVPSQELYNMMTPEFFLESSQASDNEKWATGEPLGMDPYFWRYFFSYKIPENLAGEEVCVRAKVEPPPYGPMLKEISIILDNRDCIKIIAPCSEEDIDHALASKVWMLSRAGLYEQAALFADSLVDTGWRSFMGLNYALKCARKSGLPQYELKFIDTQYEKYGNTGLETEFINDSPSPAEKQHSFEAYQRKRESILQRLEEQQLDSLK